MAQGSPQCRTYSCVPDVYVKVLSTESRDRPDCGHHEHAGPGDCSGPSRKEHARTGGDPSEDLIEAGFIPYNELELEDLPPDIRTQKNLERIRRIGERVVRINNYKVSSERNKNEEMKVRGTSLQGSGLIFDMSVIPGRRGVLLCTNQHVIYNEEELEKSNFDIFFDSYGARSQCRKMVRTERGSGLLMFRQNSERDLSMAFFDIDPASKVNFEQVNLENEDTARMLYLLPRKKERGPEESYGKDIVCVISHPLGRSKHVSFGEIVEWNFEKNTFLYNAPTKPGSSGAPIIIFTPSLCLLPKETHFYHEGTDKRTGLGVGHIEKRIVFQPKCLIDESRLWSALSRPRHAKFHEQFVQQMKGLSQEVVRLEAQVETVMNCLAGFLPIFAAFVLQPEKYCSSVRRLPQARPCQKLSQADTQLTKKDETFFSGWFSSEFEQCLSVLPHRMESDKDEAPSLSALLTSETPCWCQAIVDAVVQHSASENEDSGDCFLRPDAVYGESPFPKTWPWSRDASRSHLRPGMEPLLNQCLLKECMDMLRKNIQGFKVFLLLLVLIRKANYMLAQSLSETIRGKEEDPDSCKKTESISADHTESPLTGAHALNSVNPSLSKCQRAPRVFDVCILLLHRVTDMSFLLDWIPKVPAHIFESEFLPENLDKDYVKNFYSTVDLIIHVKTHSIRDHPDHAPCQGDLSPQPDCTCGRPSWEIMIEALKTVAIADEAIYLKDRSPEQSPLSDVDSTIHPGHLETKCSVISLILKEVLECRSEYEDKPCPLEELLTRIDTLDNFRNSRDLISLAVTSQEVFLFNCRHLLRQCYRLVSPCYISAPVSVFGRPGQWPAGVTPVTVKDTAWSLIQAACGKSLFGRRFLEVLKQDPDRREKLIDWYVDMKQLKFAGDIEEEVMNTESLLLVLEEENMRKRSFGFPQAFSDNPTYFVMKTFLTLVEPIRPQMSGRHEENLCILA